MWVAVGGYNTNTIAYSYDGINWKGLGSDTFHVFANGIAWSGTSWNGKIGDANIVGGSIVLHNSNGLRNNLDVVSDTYYNSGFTNFSLSITT
jgi:hypothetical protein